MIFKDLNALFYFDVCNFGYFELVGYSLLELFLVIRWYCKIGYLRWQLNTHFLWSKTWVLNMQMCDLSVLSIEIFTMCTVRIFYAVFSLPYKKGKFPLHLMNHFYSINYHT